jgi:hypothetical protein
LHVTAFESLPQSDALLVGVDAKKKSAKANFVF